MHSSSRRNGRSRALLRAPFAISLLALAAAPSASAQDLLDGMISYWPLEVIEGGRTPDLKSGYSMNARALTEDNIEEGRFGMAFRFDGSRSVLHRTNIVEGPEKEDLPLEQHDNFSISMWVKGDGNGQVGGRDRRVFSEGSNKTQAILFNLGTQSNADGTGQGLDLYIRNSSGAASPNHNISDTVVFDDEWHHIVYLQEEFAITVYIDGVKTLFDSGLEAAESTRPLGDGTQTNTTTIGGILRSDFSHWYTGLIDEVAVWKRLLTEEEITILSTEAPPQPVVALPLAIRSFAPDRPTVAEGGPLLLRWEGSPDASYKLDPGDIDVTAATVGGAGEITVMPTGPTTYTLTASRGAESVTSTLSAGILTGVAEGWTLVGNFETFEEGNIADVATPFWFNTEAAGRWHVLDFEGNKVAGSIPGDGVISSALGPYEIADGETRTVFFHAYIAPGFDGIEMRTGITNKPLIGFAADTDGGLGAYMTIFRDDEAATADIETLDGFEAGVLPVGKWFGIWMEITNSIDDSDRFTAYAQASDAAGRTLLVEESFGDRGNADPIGSFFVAGKALNFADDGFLLDNVFISQEPGTLDTLPVAFPSGPVVVVPGVLFAEATYDGTDVVVTWSGEAGSTYTIERSEDLVSWATASAVATGNTFTEAPPAGVGETRLYYRVSGPNP